MLSVPHLQVLCIGSSWLLCLEPPSEYYFGTVFVDPPRLTSSSDYTFQRCLLHCSAITTAYSSLHAQHCFSSSVGERPPEATALHLWSQDQQHHLIYLCHLQTCQKGTFSGSTLDLLDSQKLCWGGAVGGVQRSPPGMLMHAKIWTLSLKWKSPGGEIPLMRGP